MKKTKQILRDEKLCFYLLKQYPLFSYRKQEGNTYKLNILLVGYNAFMKRLLHILISQGQLLDTSLNITIGCDGNEKVCEALKKEAPYLPHFSKILVDDEVIDEPENKKDILLSLNFKSSFDLKENNDYSYVVISTGDSKLDASFKRKCKKYLSSDALVTSLDTKKIKSFDWDEDDPVCKELERVGLNYHIAYSKKYSPERTIKEIKDEFYNKQYIFNSNIQSALHLYAKLDCCGIEANTNDELAEQFDTLIKKRKNTIEKLAALEHRRWMLDKILDGYVQLDDMHKIFQDGCTTHSEVDKWHCCIVNSDLSGKSIITDDDWDDPKEKQISKLDPLDQISLKVHKQCKQIMNKKKQEASSALLTIKNTINKDNAYSSNTRNLFRQLELEFTQLCQYKKGSANRIYSEVFDIEDLIKQESKSHTLTTLHTLDTFKENIAPIVEYVTRKDYKEFDRYLVERIPFCLTNKPKPTLMKLLSTNTRDNVFSPFKLEPTSVTYVTVLENDDDLKTTYNAIKEIDWTIKTLQCKPKVEYLLLIDEELYEHNTKKIKQNKNITYIHLKDTKTSTITKALNEIVLTVDYIDTTGAEHSLLYSILNSDKYKNATLFYVKKGNIYSTKNAKELTYKSYSIQMSVDQMFKMNGIENIASDSTYCTISLNDIFAIWNIRTKWAKRWIPFTQACGSAYRGYDKHIGKLTFRNFDDKGKEKEFKIEKMPFKVFSAILPILRDLEIHSLISNFKFNRNNGNTYTISYKTFIKYSSLDSYLKNCISHQDADFSFRLEENNGMFIIKNDDFNVHEFPANYINILNNLNQEKIICNFKKNDNKNKTFDFKFKSKDHAKILTMAGANLEYYVYSTALAEAGFHDAQMSVEYSFSNFDEEGNNEIDVICTDDANSMFISCKDLIEYSLQSKFNYILYEISLEAEKYGINPKTCLAAPQVNIFDDNEEKKLSGLFLQAKRRGVYLIGKECFKNPDTLGKVLRNIMDGKDNWYGFLK